MVTLPLPRRRKQRFWRERAIGERGVLHMLRWLVPEQSYGREGLPARRGNARCGQA